MKLDILFDIIILIVSIITLILLYLINKNKKKLFYQIEQLIKIDNTIKSNFSKIK